MGEAPFQGKALGVTLAVATIVATLGFRFLASLPGPEDPEAARPLLPPAP